MPKVVMELSRFDLPYEWRDPSSSVARWSLRHYRWSMKIVLDTSLVLQLYIPEIHTDSANEIMLSVNRRQI